VTQTPTAELSARRILEVFLTHNLKGGDVLQTDSFIAPFNKPGWGSADLDAGIDYAVAEDWIELVSAHSYRLTPEGFAET